jgi:hypothetical protein
LNKILQIRFGRKQYRGGSEDSATLMALVDIDWISKEKDDQPIKDDFNLTEHSQTVADIFSAIHNSDQIIGAFNATRHWMNNIKMTKEVLDKRKKKVEMASQHDENKLLHIINFREEISKSFQL